MLLCKCDYFFRYERPDLLLCGDVLCKQDCWREEMVDLRYFQTIRSYEPTARLIWQVGFLFWA